MNPSSNSPNSGSHGKRPMVPPMGEFKCGQCGRVFTTITAFFGHKANLGGVVRCSAKAKETTVAAVASLEAGGGGKEDGRTLAEGEGSSRGMCNCGDCGQVFPTITAFFEHKANHGGVIRCSAKAKETTVAAVAALEAGCGGNVDGRTLAEGEGSSRGMYECGDCGQVFPTMTAFCEHKDNHGVVRRGAKAKKETTVAAKAKETTVAAVAMEFVCSVCGLQFDTYRGMRIHQHIHRGRQGVAAEGGREGRGLMVDLNLPPPPEEEEQEVDEEGRNKQG